METYEIQEKIDCSEIDALCPVCDGADAAVIGILGKKVYCRCCACGWQYNPIDIN